MRNVKTATALALMVLFVAGCANIPMPGKSDPYESLSQEERDNLRLREVSKVRVDHPGIENYLSEVLTKLYDEEALAKHNTRIALIASPSPGAAVLPDGLVIWHLGTFDYLESEDEVAAVLAHEMTHLVAQHHETDSKGSFVGDVVDAGKAAIIFSDAGSARELITAADSLRWATDSVMFPAFTRDQETEADVEAARILVDAGYNADAVRVVLGTLRKYYGDQKEFVAQDMLKNEKVEDNGVEKTRVSLSTEAVVGNLKGYVENTWGQAYESFTERESAVRTVLREEFPQRSRSQFRQDSLMQLLEAEETEAWLEAHRVGYELEALELTDDKALDEFRSMSEKLMADARTSELFDYDVLFKAALRNGLEQPARDAAEYLIKSNKAHFEHYLIYGNLKRQEKDYERALVAFNVADVTFSASQDRVILPLIIATKEEAGQELGHMIKLRCLDPTLTAACMQK